MDFILGLGVIVLGMLALNNNNKKNKNIDNIKNHLPDPSVGDPSFGEINSSSNNDIKSNMNNYIKYKKKYLKEKELYLSKNK
jgi:hypothetical protein